MASQLETTWKILHPRSAQVKVKPVSSAVTLCNCPIRPSDHTAITSQHKVKLIAQPKSVPSFTMFYINTPDGTKAVEILNSVKDIFFNEAQIPEDNDTITTVDVAHVAMLLFAGHIDAATTMSESCGGGGGSAPEADWGKKDDEDDLLYARRCIATAHSICKPKPRQRKYHR